MTEDKGLTPIKDLLGELMDFERPTPIQARIIEAQRAKFDGETDADQLLFHHTSLCQTSLPYPDPGDVRTWERLNGHVHLKVLAGEAMHPKKGRFVELGLPFGPKARLIWMHINQRALAAKSPEIEIQTCFRYDSATSGMSSALSKRIKQPSFRTLGQEALLNVLVACDTLRQETKVLCDLFRVTASQFNVLRILRGAYPEGYRVARSRRAC